MFGKFVIKQRISLEIAKFFDNLLKSMVILANTAMWAEFDGVGPRDFKI